MKEIIGKNIEFCMKTKNISIRKLAQLFEGTRDEPQNRGQVYRWIKGTVIPRKDTIDKLETIFGLPKDTLCDPELQNNWIYKMMLNPTSFKITENDYSVKREDLNSFDPQGLLIRIIELLGYGEYNPTSAEFQTIYSKTLEYIHDLCTKNRPQQ